MAGGPPPPSPGGQTPSLAEGPLELPLNLAEPPSSPASPADAEGTEEPGTFLQQQKLPPGVLDWRIEHPEVDWYRSSMHPRLGFFARRFLVPLFSRVRFDASDESRIREAAAQGTVVYLMRTVSILNFLFFNYALLERGLPLARYATGIFSSPWGPSLPGLRNMWLKLRHYLKFGRLPDPVQSGYLSQVIALGFPVLLFLQKTWTWFNPFRWLERPPDVMTAVIAAQRRSEKPIFVVPQLLVWDKKPDRREKTFFDVLFGDRLNPGPVREVGRFLLNYRRAFVVVGEPINVQKFIAERGAHRPDETLGRVLRRVTLIYLSSELQVVQGPNARPRRLILRKIVQDEEVQRTIQEVAQAEKRPHVHVERRAERYLTRVSADISMSVLDIADWVLRQVWSRIYDGVVVDPADFERLRKVARQATVVFIPCHRSHVDYLLLSYLLMERDFAVPHIAAGINLSFWPMGAIFRRGGAFFIQRSFRNDRLRPLLIKKYLWSVLQEGHSIEFFIEGGRSRSGKLYQPKLGLLSMVADFTAHLSRQEVVLVPVSINYERVVEVRSYVRELEGGEKRPENLQSVLSSSKTLWNRYGKVYVRFLEPISLNSYLEAQPTPYRVDSPWEEKKAVLEPLGLQVMDRIAWAMPVMAGELVATAVLNHTRRGILEVDLMARVARLRTLFQSIGAALPDDLDAGIQTALLGLLRDKYLTEYRDSERRIFAINENRRLGLDYLKNSAITPLVPESMLCLCLRSFFPSVAELGPLKERFVFLHGLWKDEFIFDPRLGAEGLFQRALGSLHRWKILLEVPLDDGYALALNREGRADFEELEALLHSYLEAYYVVLRTLGLLREERLREKELTRRLLEQAKALYMTQEIERKEATSSLTLKGALKVLRELGIVQATTSSAGEEGRSDPLLVVEPAGWQQVLKQVETLLGRG